MQSSSRRLIAFVFASLVIVGCGRSNERSVATGGKEPPTGSKVQVVSLMPEFWAALSIGDADERANRFASALRAHPRLYGPVLPADADVKAYLEQVQPFVSGMRELEPIAIRQVNASLAQLQAVLPPLQSTYVYLTPSLFTSNGQVRVVDGASVVALGLDVQAYAEQELLPRESRNDLRALVAHELFHAQHYEMNREMRALANRLFDEKEPAPLYVNLWIEGLATCVSMGLDEDGSTARALMSSELPEKLPAALRTVATEMQAQLTVRDLKVLGDYFWLNTARKDIPARVGYGVGALAAADVVERIGLQRATEASAAEVLNEVRASLQKLTAPDYEIRWESACARIAP